MRCPGCNSMEIEPVFSPGTENELLREIVAYACPECTNIVGPDAYTGRTLHSPAVNITRDLHEAYQEENQTARDLEDVVAEQQRNELNGLRNLVQMPARAATNGWHVADHRQYIPATAEAVMNIRDPWVLNPWAPAAIPDHLPRTTDDHRVLDPDAPDTDDELPDTDD